MEKEKDKMQSTRKNGKHLRVPVLYEEEAAIKQNAEAAGLTVAAFLRNVGMGYQIKGIVDNNEVEKLAKINGDLGRLGGLLKLWLTNDERTAHFNEATIRAVLSRIVDTQDKMVDVMRSIVRPRTEK
ncbi:MAG: conjugal transfer transcriptional regulator TraJ [Methylococcaceae bacterium]|nr:conjugal transfer transcriptional regulator TraJ [Methylococcaceae bacterium]